MTDEIPESVDKHVRHVMNSLIQDAVERDSSLQEIADASMVNEYTTSRMERLPIEASMTVIDADDNLDLETMAANYDDYDSHEKATRHFAALCLQQIVYDRIDTIAPPDGD